ncbi:MAG: hypothetical protein M3253_02155, partial [Chloroflexota bacterium]|nr:hypothetical protein [Chloroflexota bacterium]
ANLPALDVRSAALFMQGDDIVGRIELADANVAAMQRDLIAYNAVSQVNLPAERLQYVLSFAEEFDVFHLSMETLAGGSQRFFGGRLDTNDGLVNPTSPTSILGTGYHTDAVTVSGSVNGNVITIRAPAADFGLALGSRLYSATAVAMAGPAEANELTIAHPMRTVDASPPFNVTLAERDDGVTLTPIDCADERVSSSGGWHVLEDERAGDGTLCRLVVNKPGKGKMELHFQGSAVDVVLAKGPRGGLVELALDGAPAQTVDLHRPASDPAKPDNSGRKDLDFGVPVRLETEPGDHVLRITALPADGEDKRDMAYVDGFVLTDGQGVEPPPGTPGETRTIDSGILAGTVQSTFNVVADTLTQQLTAVVEAAPDTTVSIVGPTGEVLATADARDGVAVVQVAPQGALTYRVVVGSSNTANSHFTLWTVMGRLR